MSQLPAPHEPIATKAIGDRSYALFQHVCSECGKPHLSILRTVAGRIVSTSRYLMPPEFQSEDFAEWVEHLDDDLLFPASEALADFRASLDRINSRVGISVDPSFAFLLAEYGRQRALTLQRLDCLAPLLNNNPPANDAALAIRAAFELGMAATEHRMFSLFEEDVDRGLQAAEWQQQGLPKAIETRRLGGAKTRAAVLERARELYNKDHLFVRNDSATARVIQKLLRQDGMERSIDCITRHLREARNERQLVIASENRKMIRMCRHSEDPSGNSESD